MQRSALLLPVLWGALGMFAICTGVFVYLFLEHEEQVNILTTERDEWQAKHASSSQKLQIATEELAAREQELQSLSNRLDRTQDDLRDAEQENDDFRDQIEDLTGTVANLDRLARIDEELLQKYSRVYFLNENYRPEHMTKIDNRWVLEGRDEQYVHSEMHDSLEEMLEDAKNDDIDLRVLSAFRSFDEQNQLKGQFTRQYGTGANTFSADQGYSEHQLSTAVDIVDPGTGAAVQSFAQTEAYEWLQDNAHEYGFILSYPEGNQYYIFEPWHWRFVGVELATDLHDADANFYDWDQRRIDEYLIDLFE